MVAAAATRTARMMVNRDGRRRPRRSSNRSGEVRVCLPRLCALSADQTNPSKVLIFLYLIITLYIINSPARREPHTQPTPAAPATGAARGGGAGGRRAGVTHSFCLSLGLFCLGLGDIG